MKSMPPIEERAWITEEELAHRLGFSSKGWFSRLRKKSPRLYPPVAELLSKRPIKFMKTDVEEFESKRTRK